MARLCGWRGCHGETGEERDPVSAKGTQETGYISGVATSTCLSWKEK